MRKENCTRVSRTPVENSWRVAVFMAMCRLFSRPHGSGTDSKKTWKAQVFFLSQGHQFRRCMRNLFVALRGFLFNGNQIIFHDCCGWRRFESQFNTIISERLVLLYSKRLPRGGYGHHELSSRCFKRVFSQHVQVKFVKSDTRHVGGSGIGAEIVGETGLPCGFV